MFVSIHSVTMEVGGLILFLKYSTFTKQSIWLKALLNIFVKANTKLTVNSLFKMDTFGTGTKCPSLRDVHLMESQIKGVKKGRDQL